MYFAVILKYYHLNFPRFMHNIRKFFNRSYLN